MEPFFMDSCGSHFLCPGKPSFTMEPATVVDKEDANMETGPPPLIQKDSYRLKKKLELRRI